MLNVIEWPLSVPAQADVLLGADCPTGARAMVPMLDWPTDLFNKFAIEVEDEAE